MAETVDPADLYDREELFRRRLEASGVPPRWRAASWEELDVGESPARRGAVDAARRWSRGEGDRGLLLSGAVGIGKTRIAATAAAERLRREPVRWLSVADLIHRLRMPFSSPEYAEAARRLAPSRRASWALVLDDLDKVRPTEQAVSSLYLAVNEWIERDAPLLVTMNRTLDDLAEDFGERFGAPIASRLAEHCEVFELSGRDRRLDP